MMRLALAVFLVAPLLSQAQNGAASFPGTGGATGPTGPTGATGPAPSGTGPVVVVSGTASALSCTTGQVVWASSTAGAYCNTDLVNVAGVSIAMAVPLTVTGAIRGSTFSLDGTSELLNFFGNTTLRNLTGGTGIRLQNYNGTEWVFINNTGKVGIGTLTQASTLDINGNLCVGTCAGTTAAPANGLLVSGQVQVSNTTTAIVDSAETNSGFGFTSGNPTIIKQGITELNINNTVAAFTHAISATNGTLSGALTVTGHTTFEGVTSTGATGTGNLVYSASPTMTGTLTITSNAMVGSTGGINGLWLNGNVASASAANYAVTDVGSGTIFNTPGSNSMAFRQANANMMTLSPAGTVLVLGGKYQCTKGTNATCGVSALAAGTVTVSTTAAATLAAAGGTGSKITLVLQNCTSCGSLSVGTVTNGTSFVINSTNVIDASNVYWEIGTIN